MKQLVRTLTLAALVILGAVAFSSCDDGDGPWNNGPDNTYYDRNLQGTWELVDINGTTVMPSQRNYLEFMGNGRGYYFYYSGGFQRTEQIIWVCNAGYYRDSITIRYQDGSQATMNYSFSSGAQYLYLDWTTYNGQQYSYTYRYLGSQIAPW